MRNNKVIYTDQVADRGADSPRRRNEGDEKPREVSDSSGGLTDLTKTTGRSWAERPIGEAVSGDAVHAQATSAPRCPVCGGAGRVTEGLEYGRLLSAECLGCGFFFTPPLEACEEEAPPTDPAPPPIHEPSWEEVEEEARPAWPALVGPAAKAMERLWPGSSEPRYLRSLAERAEALSRLREELARLVAMAHGARLTSAPESVIVAGDAAYEALSALQGAVREAMGGVR